MFFNVKTTEVQESCNDSSFHVADGDLLHFWSEFEPPVCFSFEIGSQAAFDKLISDGDIYFEQQASDDENSYMLVMSCGPGRFKLCNLPAHFWPRFLSFIRSYSS